MLQNSLTPDQYSKLMEVLNVHQAANQVENNAGGSASLGLAATTQLAGNSVYYHL